MMATIGYPHPSAHQAVSTPDQINRNREGGAAPVREAAGLLLVLLDQEPPRQLVLLTVLDDASVSPESLIGDAYRDPGRAAQVLHPVRDVAVREHVERLAVEGEPDLDLVRTAGHPARRRQVAILLVPERAQPGRHPGVWAVSRCLSSTRRILPLVVLGSSSMNSIRRGYLYGAVWALQKSWISRASSPEAS